MDIETDYYSEAAATFGDRIAAARENAGYTQAELAEGLGVKTSTILDWENDQLEPRANKLQMLSGVLNVSMRWLLTGVGGELSPPGSETSITPELGAVLAELRELKANADTLSLRIGHLESRLRNAVRKT